MGRDFFNQDEETHTCNKHIDSEQQRGTQEAETPDTYIFAIVS